MSLLGYYGPLILERPWVVEKTQELYDRIVAMGQDIHDCPVRSRNRPLREILIDCRGVAQEIALARIIGGELNPLAFDKRNPWSYNHDVFQGSVKFEVKPFGNQWDNFSWPRDGGTIRTFLRNHGLVDFLVAGKWREDEDAFRGQFLLVADAKTFTEYKVRSTKDGWRYYDHRAAGRDGRCMFRQEIHPGVDRTRECPGLVGGCRAAADQGA